jgi:hypothetical protein
MLDNYECRPFERELPGGGFVAIEVSPTRSVWRNPVFRGRVIVERRAASRRSGHEPPVVATAAGPTFESVVQQLFPTAQCNATIGAALMRRELNTRLARA